MQLRRVETEGEAERAHRLADEYSAIAQLYQHTNRRRYLDAIQKAKAWREYAYLVPSIPAAA